MTASPVTGMPSDEEIARLIYHAKPRNKPWDLLTHEFKNQYRMPARAILALIRPAFEAKEREIERLVAESNRHARACATAVEHLVATETKLAQAVEALEPFAGDTMPRLQRTEIAYDKNGLRRCMSPMEIAMLRARAAAAMGEKT